MIYQWSDTMKYRLTLESGRDFVTQFLVQNTERESSTDFQIRQTLTPIPAFARSELFRVRDAIYGRMQDISREGGTRLYQEAIAGRLGGVDYNGNDFSNFMGIQVLTELIAMSRVGIFVDMHRDPGTTLAESRNKHPYLYIYKSENISELEYDDDHTLIRVVLQDYSRDIIPTRTTRTIEKTDTGVYIQVEGQDPVLLNLPEIPFVLAKIPFSLLQDVVDYQITLLNLESVEIFHAFKNNFPLYTEQAQFDATSFARTENDADPAVIAGPLKGRRYQKNTDRPGFISPSTDPLKASMSKQDQIREGIKELMRTNIDHLNNGKSSGLAVIASELERVERWIAYHWAQYERSGLEITIQYPTDYTILTDAERLDLAKSKREQAFVPSLTYRKELAKQIASLSLGSGVSSTLLEQINDEIDAASVVTFDQDELRRDKELGIIDSESAASANAYPKGVAAKANEEHMTRLKEIALAQSAGDPHASRLAVNDPSTSKDGQRHVRGKGK